MRVLTSHPYLVTNLSYLQRRQNYGKIYMPECAFWKVQILVSHLWHLAVPDILPPVGRQADRDALLEWETKSRLALGLVRYLKSVWSLIYLTARCE